MLYSGSSPHVREKISRKVTHRSFGEFQIVQCHATSDYYLKGRAATIQFSSSGPGGTRVITFGGPNTLTREPGDIPSMSQFLRRGPANFDDDDQVNITGPMMAQYLMALLSARRPGAARSGTGSDPFAELFGGPGPFGAFGAGGQGHGGDGRWGDYVFNQEGMYPPGVSWNRELIWEGSFGPNYHSNNGELQFWEARTRYQRDH